MKPYYYYYEKVTKKKKKEIEKTENSKEKLENVPFCKIWIKRMVSIKNTRSAAYANYDVKNNIVKK